MDTTKSLFDHIKNRLATGYGYGDDDQVIIDNIPDHRASYQSLREDHEGDVGIFDYMTERHENYDGIDSHSLWKTRLQFSVVAKNGDIENAKKFLLASFKNLVDLPESSNVYVRGVDLTNITPAGKNSKGLQMIIMNTVVFYYINN